MTRIRKGGTVLHDPGTQRWVGQNPTGELDADFFNFLGLGGEGYWELWKYPLREGGIMRSENWNRANEAEILRLLDAIIELRTRQCQAHAAAGDRDELIDAGWDAEGHTRVLAFVKQLRSLVSDSGMDWYDADGNLDVLAPYTHIEDTPGFPGVSSEVANICNPDAPATAAEEGGLAPTAFPAAFADRLTTFKADKGGRRKTKGRKKTKRRRRAKRRKKTKGRKKTRGRKM